MESQFDEWRSLHDVIGQVLSGVTDEVRKSQSGSGLQKLQK